MPDSNHLKSLFLLGPGVTYLNFGSFGACPKPIFDDYMKWQRELETEPVQFITVNGPEYMKGFSDKPKAVFISQITSATALNTSCKGNL